MSLRDPLILQYVNGICSVLRPFRTDSSMPQRWWRDPNIGPIQRFMFVIAPPEDPTCAAGITCSARHRETVSRGQRSPLDLGRRYLTVSFVWMIGRKWCWSCLNSVSFKYQQMLHTILVASKARQCHSPKVEASTRRLQIATQWVEIPMLPYFNWCICHSKNAMAIANSDDLFSWTSWILWSRCSISLFLLL